MKKPIQEEALFLILKTSAEKQYGEERTKQLENSLHVLGRALAFVDNFPLAMEEEPAFFG